MAPFSRRQQSQPGEKPQRHKFDRELYELARTAAGPDSAAGANSHPDAIRLLGTRAAEHRWAIQDAGLDDDDRGLTLEQLRRDYPRVFQAEGADLAARPSAPERRRAGGAGRSPEPPPMTSLPRYDLRQ